MEQCVIISAMESSLVIVYHLAQCTCTSDSRKQDLRNCSCGLIEVHVHEIRIHPQQNNNTESCYRQREIKLHNTAMRVLAILKAV